MLFPQKTLRYT